MDERRHVHELDRDAGGDGWSVVGRRREERERRSKPLPACRERTRSDIRDDPRVQLDRPAELALDLREILVEPGCGADDLEGRHGFVPTCSATMPPPSSR